MGRLIAALLITGLLSSCTVVAAVSGTAIDGLYYMFRGEKESFTMDMRTSLVAVQNGMRKSGLNVNVLEPAEDGYLIAFGNINLDGKIELKKQTRRLTTVEVKVKSNGLRRASIERAILSAVQEESKNVSPTSRFDASHYRNIREKPDVSSLRVGKYLPGTLLQVKTTDIAGWMSIKMPSGKTAYLKGNIAASAHK